MRSTNAHLLADTLSVSTPKLIMRPHEQSAVTLASASTVLPSAKVIQLPTAKPSTRVAGGFTRISINKLHCPPGKSEALFWDATCRGFGIRALKSGRRSWIYQYRDEHKRTRRIVIGDVSAVSLHTARTVARRHAANVTQGANPSVQRKAKRAAVSVLEVIEAYLRHAKARQRPRSYQETERHLRRHAAPLHHDRVEAVSRRDIAELLERVAKASGPVAANRLRAALSALWTWGLRTGLIEADSNPVSFTLKQVEKARDRTLTDDELKAIWTATEDDGDYSRIVRLCLLTGCRREEIGGLRWDEVQEDQLRIGTERMKGGIAHEIPLLPTITETLPVRHDGAQGCVFGRRGNGFSGWSKSKQALDAKLATAGHHLKPWTLHDLRRTFSTRLHDAGIEPLVVEALLAHKQHGVAAVYNRASFREAKRVALTRWHDLFKCIVNDLGKPCSNGTVNR
jgi:integrase